MSIIDKEVDLLTEGIRSISMESVEISTAEQKRTLVYSATQASLAVQRQICENHLKQIEDMNLINNYP